MLFSKIFIPLVAIHVEAILSNMNCMHIAKSVRPLLILVLFIKPVRHRGCDMNNSLLYFIRHLDMNESNAQNGMTLHFHHTRGYFVVQIVHAVKTENIPPSR